VFSLNGSCSTVFAYEPSDNCRVGPQAELFSESFIAGGDGGGKLPSLSPTAQTARVWFLLGLSFAVAQSYRFYVLFETFPNAD
jgi:hypothetical protein